MSQTCIYFGCELLRLDSMYLNISLFSGLQHHKILTCILANQILQVMSFFASSEHEKERLQYFASSEGRDDLYEYNQKERRTVLEVCFIQKLNYPFY